MTKKEAFIEIIQTEIFDNPTIYTENYSEEIWNKALEFFEDLKNKKGKDSEIITKNGDKILKWMQEHVEETSNLFTAKEIGAGLFTSGRSVAGSMRKLIKDEYVEKKGKDPVQYSLTDVGKLYVN